MYLDHGPAHVGYSASPLNLKHCLPSSTLANTAKFRPKLSLSYLPLLVTTNSEYGGGILIIISLLIVIITLADNSYSKMPRKRQQPEVEYGVQKMRRDSFASLVALFMLDRKAG